MEKSDSKYASYGMLGKKHSKIGRENISKSKKGIHTSLKSEFKKGNKPWNTGKPHSYITKRKISNTLGKKKGFITPLHHLVRTSVEYKLWRISVFQRDNYTCIWCKVKSGNGKTVILQADHIKPFSLYPELRFAIDNGRTLCISCHKKTDTYGGKSHKSK